MDDIGDYPPDGEFGTGEIDVDGGELWRLRHQPDLVQRLFETPDEHLAVEVGDHDLPAGRFYGPVHDDYVPVEDTRAGHGVAAHAHKDGGGFVANELFVEIDVDFHKHSMISVPPAFSRRDPLCPGKKDFLLTNLLSKFILNY